MTPRISTFIVLATSAFLVFGATSCGSDDDSSESSPSATASGDSSAGDADDSSGGDAEGTSGEDGSGTITLTGGAEFTGSAEVLCSYDAATGGFLANFFSSDLNSVDLSVATINTLGEFDGAAGGGQISLAQYAPGETPEFAGPATGEVTFTGSADSVTVSGTGQAGDGTAIAIEGTCVPAAIVE